MKGFTYIETIIYMSIFVLMMTTLIPFAWNVIEGGAKSATQQEVAGNARFVSQIIANTIRNTTGINSVATSSASFSTTNPATNPIVFDVSNGFVRIKQGTGSAIALNSNDTSVSALLFTNYTTPTISTRNLQFVLTMTGRYATPRQEYTESVTIQTDAELR